MTDISHKTIPAGWYPDPRGLPQRRWWDGSSWTHALESPPAPPAAGPAVPAYANMPGPSVRRVPSPNAPMVHHAINAEASKNEAFPTRRQLRDAAAVVELQKQLTEPQASATNDGAPSYAMGPAVSATQKPQASFSIEQFRTVATQSATENVTKAAAELTKSPAISTAAAASLTGAPARPVAQTLPPVTAATPASAFTQTHTFTPAARAAAKEIAKEAASAPVSAAPVSAAPASSAPVSAAPVSTAPASSAPVSSATATPVAATAPATAPSIVPRQQSAAAAGASGAFVPVMRTGKTSAPATISDDIEYRPFGMTPHITTGTVEAPTHVNTGSVWLLTFMPTLLLGAVVALSILAPEFYTPFILGGLIFVFAIGSLALAISDRRQLVQRDHQKTASPAWTLLSPLAYLVARAVRTRQQAGRGWMPAIVFVLLAFGGTAAVVLTPIATTITTFAASV